MKRTIMRLVTIKTYNEAFEANLHLALLENNGIEGVIHNDEEMLINPAVITTGSVKLKVLESEAVKALNIINQTSIEV